MSATPCEIRPSQILVLDHRLVHDPDSPLYKRLYESIKKEGVVAPIVVRRLPKDRVTPEHKYELLDGVARLMIAKSLGIKLIKAIIKLGE